MNVVEERIGLKQYNYHYNFIPKYNVFYVEVSKAACSTIKSFLSELILKDAGFGEKLVSSYVNKPHVPIPRSPFVKPYQIGHDKFYNMMVSGEYRVFSVVRDPVTRFLSAYRDKIENSKAQTEEIFDFYDKQGVDLKKSSKISVLDFARFVDQTPDIKSYNQHWRPQY